MYLGAELTGPGNGFGVICGPPSAPQSLSRKNHVGSYYLISILESKFYVQRTLLKNVGIPSFSTTGEVFATCIHLVLFIPVRRKWFGQLVSSQPPFFLSNLPPSLSVTISLSLFPDCLMKQEGKICWSCTGKLKRRVLIQNSSRGERKRKLTRGTETDRQPWNHIFMSGPGMHSGPGTFQRL